MDGRSLPQRASHGGVSGSSLQGKDVRHPGRHLLMGWRASTAASWATTMGRFL
ncbi:MAG: hypothetical protein ACRDQ5_19250 [Sciscionella sp.]